MEESEIERDGPQDHAAADNDPKIWQKEKQQVKYSLDLWMQSHITQCFVCLDPIDMRQDEYDFTYLHFKYLYFHDYCDPLVNQLIKLI